MNPFDPGYFSSEELSSFGFACVGDNVLIAKNSTIIGCDQITIGNNVRIDGFCTIIAPEGGHLKIGSYVHIAGYSFLSAGAGIEFGDFSGISQGVKIYSKTDDYTGGSLTNPTVPEAYTSVRSGKVVLGRHVIIGANSVILPKVQIGEGASVGACSLVTKSLEEWGVYFGIPVKKLKKRSRKLLEKEKELMLHKAQM